MLNSVGGYTDGIAFITTGGVISIVVALILLFMSLITWYVILHKCYQLIRLRSQFKQFEKLFWQSGSIDNGLKVARGIHHPMSDLTTAAIKAARHYQAHEAQFPAQNCSYDEFILRAMRQSFSNASFGLEKGLTVLATIGSVAPFVGLFGTVWGIYHALINISVKQQATLDAVAGPVGEALIMTAIGLAVAIPAVLAYNFILRMQRTLFVKLEVFSSQLHILLTTGKPIGNEAHLALGTTTPFKMQEPVWVF
ncbi:MAG: MotA/TolQ/ExbB proton channel family protein [Methylophilus sp.]|nr:MotA/TolQ/ExbB proton channel family protein [Methylophilus sp.]